MNEKDDGILIALGDADDSPAPGQVVYQPPNATDGPQWVHPYRGALLYLCRVVNGQMHVQRGYDEDYQIIDGEVCIEYCGKWEEVEEAYPHMQDVRRTMRESIDGILKGVPACLYLKSWGPQEGRGAY